MSPVNGSEEKHELPLAAPAVPEKPRRPRFSQKRVKQLLEKLAVPFDPAIIQWQVVETAWVSGRLRGRALPYADKVAYVERLNELFTPSGWTDCLLVHTGWSEPGEHGRRGRAKVVVTCQLTINGLGSHSSTGEKWASDDNAATSAEAQALKRACTRFGLGNYLNYFFRGLWLDLDSRKEPKSLPPLPTWATPAGWLGGARPSIERVPDDPESIPGLDPAVIRQIEAMQNDLSHPVYRRILGRHRIWFPKDIREPETATKILAEMREVAPLMLRAAYALEQIGQPAFDEVIRSFHLKSVADFGELGLLERIVQELESKLTPE